MFDMGNASITRRNTDTMPAAVSFLFLASIFALTNAHQSISYPTPISFDLACRIGLGRNCPGPCPTRLLRKDQSPMKPVVTNRRGGVLPVHILKNNHVGGFARWSLVPVRDMYSKLKHAQAAFLFTCADVEVTKCTKENQERDCKVDRLNEYYRYDLRIPRVYPDGYYVLGWLWYGGLVSTGTHGAFGEYWDCVYVEIKGGPTAEEHQPTFHAGATLTGQSGMCKATTNRVGHCFREPCPFGNRPGMLMKPEEFEGSGPQRIMKKDFGSADGKQQQVTHSGSHHSLEMRDSGSNGHDADPEEKVSEELLKRGPDETVTMSPKEWNSITGLTKSNLQNVELEDVKNFNVDPSDTGNHTGRKQGAQNMKDEQPKQKQMVAGLTNKPAGIGTKKVAKQRKLQRKKLRKQRKLQKRKRKKAGKKELRRKKLEAKRLRRERIKAKRVKKRERKKKQKQRRKGQQ